MDTLDSPIPHLSSPSRSFLGAGLGPCPQPQGQPVLPYTKGACLGGSSPCPCPGVQDPALAMVSAQGPRAGCGHAGVCQDPLPALESPQLPPGHRPPHPMGCPAQGEGLQPGRMGSRLCIQAAQWDPATAPLDRNSARGARGAGPSQTDRLRVMPRGFIDLGRDPPAPLLLRRGW